MADKKILIVVDASDLYRVSAGMRAAAPAINEGGRAAMGAMAGLRESALRKATPFSTREDPRRVKHLRDSYFLLGVAGAVQVVTSEGTKWNRVTQGWSRGRWIEPVNKRALSWPGMLGPYPQNDWGWGPGSSYSVPPVANVKSAAYYAGQDILGNSDIPYGGDATDTYLMQVTADELVAAITESIRAGGKRVSPVKKDILRAAAARGDISALKNILGGGSWF